MSAIDTNRFYLRHFYFVSSNVLAGFVTRSRRQLSDLSKLHPIEVLCYNLLLRKILGTKYFEIFLAVSFSTVVSFLNIYDRPLNF